MPSRPVDLDPPLPCPPVTSAYPGLCAGRSGVARPAVGQSGIQVWTARCCVSAVKTAARYGDYDTGTCWVGSVQHHTGEVGSAQYRDTQVGWGGVSSV